LNRSSRRIFRSLLQRSENGVRLQGVGACTNKMGGAGKGGLFERNEEKSHQRGSGRRASPEQIESFMLQRASIMLFINRNAFSSTGLLTV